MAAEQRADQLQQALGMPLPRFSSSSALAGLLANFQSSLSGMGAETLAFLCRMPEVDKLPARAGSCVLSLRSSIASTCGCLAGVRGPQLGSAWTGGGQQPGHFVENSDNFQAGSAYLLIAVPARRLPGPAGLAKACRSRTHAEICVCQLHAQTINGRQVVRPMN